MNRRELLTTSSALLAVSALPGLAHAQAGAFKEGVNYQRLSQPVPVSAPAGKVEVIEFFWYSCPHCNQFEPTLDAWVKKLPPDIAFKRVHVGFRPSFEPQQRLFATLEAMGLVDRLHAKVFQAVHVERQRLDRPESILDWVVKQGVDRAKFAETYNSFGIQSKVKAFSKLSEAYKLEGVPAIGVHGRYLTSPSMAGGPAIPEEVAFARTLELAMQLAQQVKKAA